MVNLDGLLSIPYAEGKKINWKDGVAEFWHILKFNLFA